MRVRSTFEYLVPTNDDCLIGGVCQFYKNIIGITLDDILRDAIQPNAMLHKQPWLVKFSAALTVVMLITGLINSILSFLTFRSKESRQVGCGVYLLASSMTSSLTICLFTVQYWFFVLTESHAVGVSSAALRVGCKIIEPLLKLFLYVDNWFNACVAAERFVHILKGTTFDKTKSIRMARWVIIILPVCILVTLLHEPLHRELFETKDANDRRHGFTNERQFWCFNRYSSLVHTYNTVILFVHLVGPCIINLFSAAFIIVGSARQRSTVQSKRTFLEHLRQQLREHNQLLVSPVILILLALPRVIISLLPSCLNWSRYSWLLLCAYFISFVPAILICIVFVLPSELYRKQLKASLRCCQRR